MLFNSPEFIIFFLFVYCSYLLLPFRLQNYLLLVASYIFYGWWDIRFLFLVALSTTVDYWVGLTTHRGWLSRSEKLVPSLFPIISAVTLEPHTLK
jgi:D-alanyl-lipoteichoic acid acyltransferase DltB (MBOAT superfamily)